MRYATENGEALVTLEPANESELKADEVIDPIPGTPSPMTATSSSMPEPPSPPPVAAAAAVSPDPPSSSPPPNDAQAEATKLLPGPSQTREFKVISIYNIPEVKTDMVMKKLHCWRIFGGKKKCIKTKVPVVYRRFHGIDLFAVVNFTGSSGTVEFCGKMAAVAAAAGGTIGKQEALLVFSASFNICMKRAGESTRYETTMHQRTTSSDWAPF